MEGGEGHFTIYFSFFLFSSLAYEVGCWLDGNVYTTPKWEETLISYGAACSKIFRGRDNSMADFHTFWGDLEIEMELCGNAFFTDIENLELFFYFPSLCAPQSGYNIWKSRRVLTYIQDHNGITTLEIYQEIIHSKYHCDNNSHFFNPFPHSLPKFTCSEFHT